MRIPADAIIASEKLRDYLLVHQERSDKSAFLAVAGFQHVWLQESPEVFRFVTLVPRLKR